MGFLVHVLHVLNLFKLSLDISAPKWNYFRHYGALLLFSTVFDHVTDSINWTEVEEAICKTRTDLATSWLYL